MAAVAAKHPGNFQWLPQHQDLERFASQHRMAFNAALGLELHGAPSDSTFLNLFERVDLQSLLGLPRWLQPLARQFGQDQASSPQSRRQPPSQCNAPLHHRRMPALARAN